MYVGVVGGRAVARRHLGHDPVFEAQALVELVAQRLLVLFGDAEQHADRAHRDLGAEVSDEVEPALADERVERAGGVGAHLGLDGGQPPRREHAAEQAAVQVVVRRVLEDEHARRHLDLRLDDLEHRALGGAVGLPLVEALLDVLVAAERVELVLLVEVERRLVAQPLPDRIRIGVDFEVVRVVVRRRRGHGHHVSLAAPGRSRIPVGALCGRRLKVTLLYGKSSILGGGRAPHCRRGPA